MLMKKNRVLMLIENTTYPLDIRVHHEAETLTKAGYQVSVICQQGHDQPWRENINGVFVYRYPQPPQGRNFLNYALEYFYSFIATFFYSLFVWAQRGFDIIHSANPPDTAVFLALFYRLFGKKFVFDHHDLAPEMYLVRSKKKTSQIIYRLLIWMEKTSFRFAHHVIATNKSYKKIAMLRGNVLEEHITIVRNGPSLDISNNYPPSFILIEPETFIIGYIGAIALQDGLDYLLRALHQLRTNLGRNDFSCIIIGDGSALSELKLLTKHLSLDQHVIFTGFISHTDALKQLSHIDIGVDPDPSNIYNDCGTMIKLMEYMALSKPIVAFDLPEHRVTAGEAAIYARPNDELDFAKQIQTLMDDPELRQKMGQIGRERVEKELAWPYQANHLLEAYEKITAGIK